MLNIATRQNYVVGKWSSWERPEDVDRLWAKVALATVRGELGCASKVLVTKGKKTKKGQDSMKTPSRFLPDIHV